MDELYSVNQLAGELGITPRTLRFYEGEGLLAPRRVGTARVYTRRDRARLLLILRGKRLGFSLAEIKEFLDLYDADRTQVEQLRLLESKVRQRLADLARQRQDLDATIAELSEIEYQVTAALRERGVTG